jgi:outer membrane protein assembly factor BamA
MLISPSASFTFPYMRVCLVFLFASLLLPPALLGQSATDAADKLESVQVTGSARFRSEQIAAAVGLHPGSAVSRDDLQKAANDIAQLGVFANVEYRYETLPGGVHAEYKVKDAPSVAVTFDNFPWFTDEELTAAIEKAGVLFDGTAPVHGTVLDAMSAALEKLIASHGVFTGVSHMLMPAPLDGGQMQQFHVEGSDVNIAAIEFSDALAKGDPGIHARLSDLVGKPFSRTTIALFETEQVRPVYLAHGYLHVRFGEPTLRMAEGSTGASARNITAVVSVDPGRAFSWNGVTWTGNSAVSSLDLDQSVPLHQGDPADGTRIEAGWENVRQAYRHLGYLDVEVQPAVALDDASGKAAYTVHINEGPRYHMGTLVLTGLSVEGERRIRAAWRIPPGAVFDQHAYDQFIERGIAEAFMGLPVHYEKIGHFLETNPSTATVDVLLDFQ